MIRRSPTFVTAVSQNVEESSALCIGGYACVLRQEFADQSRTINSVG